MISISQSLDDDINALFKDLLREKANEILDEFYDIAYGAIEHFYEDYVPFQYRRMDSLYGTVQKIEPKWDGKGYVCGLKFDDSIVATNHDSSEYVFYGAMEMGVHGSALVATTAPSPAEKIMDYYDSL